MIYLLDTNVLIRSIQVSHQMHKDAGRATESLLEQGHQLSVVAQNLIEFWAVATRPLANNGLALSIADTAAHVKSFQETFSLLPDPPAVFDEWQRLFELHEVSGRQARRASGRSDAGSRCHPSAHF